MDEQNNNLSRRGFIKTSAVGIAAGSASLVNNSASAADETEEPETKDFKGRMKLHADIAHPINADCRRRIQGKVISAFKEEVEKSKQPGYKPVEMDVPEEDVPKVV